LFRALFYGESEGKVERIKIQRILWKRGGRIALSAVVFPKNKPPEARLVVCGRNSSVTSEMSLYKEDGPKTSRSGGVIPKNSSETVHLAANSFLLGDSSIEDLQSLADLYRRASEKTITSTLKALYEKPLAEWHKNQAIIADEHERLDEVYREKLNLTEERMPQ